MINAKELRETTVNRRAVLLDSIDKRLRGAASSGLTKISVPKSTYDSLVEELKEKGYKVKSDKFQFELEISW